MNIPKKVKIGGLVYKVTVEERLSEEHGCVGMTDSERKTIRLTTADPQSMECTFIHELLHGINVSLKEETVEFIAMALYQIIVDNPLIFKGGGTHGK